MKYYIRLDDACEKMDNDNWTRMEALLDKYNIKPLIGVIPHCEDTSMDIYMYNENFWNLVGNWIDKGFIIALHGYNHVCTTCDGGINPVNKRSEFAGLSLDNQKEKIKKGVEVFRKHGIDPKVFFAPSHTFDRNTINAILDCSNINIISDTIANSPYYKYGITFVPQQSGGVRKLPFNTVTFCYHPNNATEEQFLRLELFIKHNKHLFDTFPLIETKRKENLLDVSLRKLYFLRRLRV